MIDLAGYTAVGTTTPGAPASEGDRLGTCTHVTHRAQTWELYREGDRLHLWHGDWLKGRFEVWQRGGYYVAIAISPVRAGQTSV